MNSTLFRDMVTLMVMAFMAMVVMMLPHLNPLAVDQQKEPPGNLAARMCWTKGNVDVDMWLDGPGEPRAVGYSNDNGLLWNLTWDDLGTVADLTDVNCEHAFTRGIIAGEYTINAHCYRCAVLPIHVTLEVGVKLPNEQGKAKYKPLITTVLDLMSYGQERTVIRFAMNSDGSLVEDSVHSVYKSIRIPNADGDGM